METTRPWAWYSDPALRPLSSGLATVVVLGSSVLLATCADPAAEPDAPPLAVRDSAGVEIVENDAPLWAGAGGWTVGPEPVLHIGAGTEGDPALQFSRILGVHALTDGGVAVVDAWAPAVAFFDPGGAPLGRFDRVGTGPGELPAGRDGTVRGSFSCGADTVYVVTQPWIAAYAPPGDFVRSFSLEPLGHVRSCSGDRILAQQGFTPWRDQPGVYVDSVLLVSHDLTGTQRTVLDTLPGDERVYATGVHGGTGYARRLFGRSLSVHGRDGLVATGFGDRFQVELRDEVGTLLRSIRVPGRERPVGDADIRRFQEYVMNPYRGNDQERANLEEQLEEARSRTLPAFAELHVDPAGNVWARAYDHRDAVAFYDYSAGIRTVEAPRLEEPRRWVVLQADGRYLGEVEVPPRFVVHEIGEDRILGVWRDELDIEYVRAYPILGPGT